MDNSTSKADGKGETDGLEPPAQKRRHEDSKSEPLEDYSSYGVNTAELAKVVGIIKLALLFLVPSVCVFDVNVSCHVMYIHGEDPLNWRKCFVVHEEYFQGSIRRPSPSPQHTQFLYCISPHLMYMCV